MRDKSDNGKLTKQDFADSTFSITSVGNIGGTYCVPTILRPQGAIMGIGKSKKIAKYVEDASKSEGYRFDPADIINISITADHRVLDGATVARFAK